MMTVEWKYVIALPTYSRVDPVAPSESHLKVHLVTPQIETSSYTFFIRVSLLLYPAQEENQSLKAS
jgi:hypothetical protein